jgi:hypothetical protein
LYLDFFDPELGPVYETFDPFPSYIKYDNSKKQIVLSPPYTLADNTQATVTVYISDTYNQGIKHSFIVTVVNKPAGF